MTQQEFTQRTNVEVSYEEFNAINEVYNNCDVDKDEFCKMWCKMNRSRVIAAKVKKAAEEREQEQKMRLADLYWTLFYDLKAEEKFTLMGCEVLSKPDRIFVESMDFNTENTVASNMMYNIAVYLGIAA